MANILALVPMNAANFDSSNAEAGEVLTADGAEAQPANETMMAITLMYITIAVAAVLAVLAGAAIVIIERGQ